MSESNENDGAGNSELNSGVFSNRSTRSKPIFFPQTLDNLDELIFQNKMQKISEKRKLQRDQFQQESHNQSLPRGGEVIFKQSKQRDHDIILKLISFADVRGSRMRQYLCSDVSYGQGMVIIQTNNVPKAPDNCEQGKGNTPTIKYFILDKGNDYVFSEAIMFKEDEVWKFQRSSERNMRYSDLGTKLNEIAQVYLARSISPTTLEEVRQRIGKDIIRAANGLDIKGLYYDDEWQYIATTAACVRADKGRAKGATQYIETAFRKIQIDFKCFLSKEYQGVTAQGLRKVAAKSPDMGFVSQDESDHELASPPRKFRASKVDKENMPYNIQAFSAKNRIFSPKNGADISR